MDEMHVITRFGLALLTIGDGRTVVAHMPDLTEDTVTFRVISWHPTYEEALTTAQLLTESEESLLGITA